MMTSPQKQKNKEKKLEDDPYYISSVPMYCVLGQDMDDTIGDLFFDLHPNSFQRSPPLGLNRAKGKTGSNDAANLAKDGAVNKIVIGDPANMTVKLKPRQSRSLIKPGRPSVAKKLSQVPADEVVEISAGLKEVQVVDAVVAEIKSSPAVKRALNAKPLVSVKSVAHDVFSTRKAGTPPAQKSAGSSQMRLRSSDEKDEAKSSDQKMLATPVKPKVSSSLTMQLRSGTKKHAITPEIRKVEKQVKEPMELQLTAAKVPPARRSKSLVKPGRPSVASTLMGPPPVPEVAIPSDIVVPPVLKNQRISSEVMIVAEIIKKPPLVVKPRNNLNKPSVLHNVFATKKQMPLPAQPAHLPARLRPVKKGLDTAYTLHNASASGSVRSEASSIPRSRVSNYMAPTLSSSRRNADTGDRRSRLPNKK